MNSTVSWHDYSKFYHGLNKTSSYKKLIRVIMGLVAKKGKHEIKLILDVGCGIGSFSKELSNIFPNATIYAIDGSSGMIEKAKAINSASNIIFKIGDITNISNYPFHFDLILMNNVLYTIDDKEHLLEIIYSILNNSGKFILSDCRAKEESSYFSFLKSEIIDIRNLIPLILDLANIIKILKFNRKIDSSFKRLKKCEMEELIGNVGFKIIKEFEAYENQNIVFELCK